MTTQAPSPPAGAPPSSGGGDNQKGVDLTKAVVMPLFAFIAVAVGIWMTWPNFMAAGAHCRSETRLTVIFICSILAAGTSIFLLTTSGTEYAFIGFLLSYIGALACAPTLLLEHSGKYLALTFGWMLMLVGVPDLWMGDGIIGAVSIEQCKLWFPTASVGADHLCQEGYVTFVILAAMMVIVFNMFNTMMAMSFFFEGAKTLIDVSVPGRGRAGSQGEGGDAGDYAPVGSDPNFAAQAEPRPMASAGDTGDAAPVSGYTAVA